MYIYSTRGVVAGVAMAGLLAAFTSRAPPQDPRPFSPEVEEFAAVYLKTRTIASISDLSRH